MEGAQRVSLVQVLWPLKRAERILTYYNEHGCVHGEIALESDVIEHAREAIKEATTLIDKGGAKALPF